MRGNSHALLVFTNLLAHSDAHGIADIHPRAISEEVGLTLDETRDALLYLEKKDPESRSPEMDGCRIVRMDGHREWGWQVVNYAKYRAIRNEDDRKEQGRLSQQRWRDRNADSKQSKPSVSGRKQPKQKQEVEAEAEAEAKAEVEASKPKSKGADAPDWMPPEWIEFEQHRKEKRQSLTPTARKRLIQKLDRWRGEGKDLAAIIRNSLDNGYTGLFEVIGGGHSKKSHDQVIEEAYRLTFPSTEKDVTDESERL